LLQTAKALEAEKRAKKGWGFSTQSAGEGRGKKERKKEGGDLYRKNKFGFERQKDPPKKKDRFKIFRVWERTESAREKKAFEEGIVEIIRLRERDHKEG
jgi:hypothetical protein